MAEETGSAELAAGSWKVIFRGIDTKIVLLVVLILVISAGVTYQWDQDRRLDRERDRDSRTMYLEQHKITQGLLNSVIANQKAIIDIITANGLATKEDIAEMTYVLTLTQQRREALRLEMPHTLRRKINER